MGRPSARGTVRPAGPSRRWRARGVVVATLAAACGPGSASPINVGVPPTAHAPGPRPAADALTADAPRPGPMAPALAHAPGKGVSAAPRTWPAVASTAGMPPAATSSCESAAPLDRATLRATVEALAAPALDGRAAGTAGDRAARALIAARFACAGLRPGGDDGTFEQAFTAGGITSASVIGVLPGRDPALAADRILVTAHHDHLGDGHLGANDNASGVAALLGIAEVLARDATPPARTIVFIAFGGEEVGLLAPLADVVQQINLDMVGTARGRVAAMGTFRGLAATDALRARLGEVPRLRVGLGGVARGSDHEPLCARGIPYVFFWTPDRRCYHRRCDTPDQLDYPGLAAIAGLATDLTRDLASSPRDLRALHERRGCGLPRR